MDNKIKEPIIFIGSGRTGTTILSDIIFRHKDLGFPSNYQEMFPKVVAVNFIRRIFDNSLWRIFGKRTYNRNIFNFNNYVFRPTEGYKMWDYITSENIDFSNNFLKEAKAENRDEIRKYFEKMLYFQNKNRLTFKITGPSRLEYLSSIFPDAYFINIKRRQIPTIKSFLNVLFWQNHGIKEIKWKGVYTEQEIADINMQKDKPHVFTALQLKKIDEITNEELKNVRPKYFETTYEDLMDNPHGVIDKIFHFTGLEYDKKCYDFLSTIRIDNKFKKDEDYFSDMEIEEIKNVLINK